MLFSGTQTLSTLSHDDCLLAIIRCYAELFTSGSFTHMIFVDQSPLQNSALDGWDSRFCNRGMNSAASIAALQATLQLSPETAHRGTIDACLAYRSHPLLTDDVSSQTEREDEAFFLGEALKGNSVWFGKLMADHTALDWRDSIKCAFGRRNGSDTKVLVVASTRSGCFPADGPISVVSFINTGDEGFSYPPLAQGVTIKWGGHWCFWEDPVKFNELVLKFLD